VLVSQGVVTVRRTADLGDALRIKMRREELAVGMEAIRLITTHTQVLGMRRQQRVDTAFGVGAVT
jgi:hypothetical protein